MEKEGDRSDRPENIEQLLHVLCTWPRIGWIWEWRQMSSPEPRQFRERATTNALHGHPDFLQRYPVQEETKTVVLTTDVDWATCREPRRSKTGGALQLGDHLIAAWSRVQPRIAPSSGEAELYAGMRGISGTLGFVHMMREFNTHDWGRIVHRVDASACRAIMLKRGCGGLKHITVKSLWVQEAVRDYSIEIERISYDEMHVHILASPSSAEDLRTYLTELNAFRSLDSEGGRALMLGRCSWIGMGPCWRWECLGYLTGTPLSAGQYWIVCNSLPESQRLSVS